jgi:hypothetical protein
LLLDGDTDADADAAHHRYETLVSPIDLAGLQVS